MPQSSGQPEAAKPKRSTFQTSVDTPRARKCEEEINRQIDSMFDSKKIDASQFTVGKFLYPAENALIYLYKMQSQEATPAQKEKMKFLGGEQTVKAVIRKHTAGLKEKYGFGFDVIGKSAALFDPNSMERRREEYESDRAYEDRKHKYQRDDANMVVKDVNDSLDRISADLKQIAIKQYCEPIAAAEKMYQAASLYTTGMFQQAEAVRDTGSWLATEVSRQITSAPGTVKSFWSDVGATMKQGMTPYLMPQAPVSQQTLDSDLLLKLVDTSNGWAKEWEKGAVLSQIWNTVPGARPFIPEIAKPSSPASQRNAFLSLIQFVPRRQQERLLVELGKLKPVQAAQAEQAELTTRNLKGYVYS